VAAIITFLGTGTAAFLRARVAVRNSNVTDARAKANSEWERLQWLATMACSENATEACVGVYLLQKSKADWNSNPEQVAFIKSSKSRISRSAMGGRSSRLVTHATSRRGNSGRYPRVSIRPARPYTAQQGRDRAQQNWDPSQFPCPARTRPQAAGP
jgi:hypothetical protein